MIHPSSHVCSNRATARRAPRRACARAGCASTRAWPARQPCTAPRRRARQRARARAQARCGRAPATCADEPAMGCCLRRASWQELETLTNRHGDAEWWAQTATPVTRDRLRGPHDEYPDMLYGSGPGEERGEEPRQQLRRRRSHPRQQLRLPAPPPPDPSRQQPQEGPGCGTPRLDVDLAWEATQASTILPAARAPRRRPAPGAQRGSRRGNAT